MIGFDDAIELKQLRARVRKLEAQLSVEISLRTQLETKLAALGVARNLKPKAQIVTLIEGGLRDCEIVQLGYSKSTVEKIRRTLRDANS